MRKSLDGFCRSSRTQNRESKNIEKYSDLAWEQKKAVDHEGDGNNSQSRGT